MNTVRRDFSLIPSVWKPHFNGFAKCSIHPVILNHIFLVSISLRRSQYLRFCYWRVVVCCADAEPGTSYAAHCAVQPRGRTQRPHLLPALRPAVPASPGDGLAPEGYVYLTHVLSYFFFFQCSGSMTCWCGSGSGTADPCLWLMAPDSEPDPAIFVIDLQDANKKLIF